ncbi:MAG TPA: dihydrofolate reductase [Candidatus Saccharimonadales bacterium]|nr:dihydrofolate reductase [Candidatus Saccharimonadales bacterium]
MISIICAMTRKRVIGIGGRLPWNIPEETALFRRITLGSTMIMGRKTFEETGILGGRKSIVVTRTVDRIAGVVVCRSLEEAIEKARAYHREIFIIGGGEIFSEAIGLADRMYLSYIKKDYQGDTFFPKFDRRDWVAESRKDYKEFRHVVYLRR